jgi:hypothetical protein
MKPSRSLTCIWAIAANTVRESVRSKLLYGLLFFAVLLIGGGAVVATLSYVEGHRILQDVGMGAVRQFLGLTLTIWLQMVIMGAAFVGVSLATGAPLGASHLIFFVLAAFELALVVGIATFFSAFTTPVLAAFFTTGVWVVGHATRELRDIGARADSALLERTTWLLHRVLPDLESFNLSSEAAHLLPVTTADWVLPAIYGTGYLALVLFAAVAIFERRDLR